MGTVTNENQSQEKDRSFKEGNGTVIVKDPEQLKWTLTGPYIHSYHNYAERLCSLEFPFLTSPIKPDSTDFQCVP